MAVNGLALLLGMGLLLGTAVLFTTGLLMGRWDVLKTAVLLGVLGFGTVVAGQALDGPAFLLLAVLVFAAAVETIRYYEAG